MRVFEGRRERLRRYPALGFLMAAALLATLLPSSLIVPVSGPTQAAELAPVPGRGDAAGDMSTLDAATTGGLGAGTGGGGPGGGGPGGGESEVGVDDSGPGPGGKGANPVEKLCVGRPARQTGDPLSPPCVAYFKGDNGGATAKGVTRDTVTVAFYNHCDDNEAYEVDYANTDDPRADHLISAYWKHFNKRYQTYARNVRFIGVKPQCVGGASAAQIRGFIQDIEEKHRPFALIEVLGDGVSYHIPKVAEAEAAALRMVTFIDSTYRSEYAARAPFWISFAPDLESKDEQTASFVCQQLAGHHAVFSGNPEDRTRERKFALLYDDDRRRDDLLGALDRRCRLGGIMALTSRGKNTAAEIAGIDEMRRAGVTTLIVQIKEETPPRWEPHAVTAGWYPEWFVPSSQVENRNGRLHNQRAWSSAFATFHGRRALPLEKEPYYLAFREGCTNCDYELNDTVPQLFDELTMLFWGIQAAGPRLTPESFDKGLHAIEQRQSPNPYTPAAYFAPGNYTWVKDAALAWWDPDATVNGQRGCWRLADEGLRRRAVDWPREQLRIQTPNQPCHHSS